MIEIAYFSGALGAAARAIQGIAQHDRFGTLGSSRDHVDSALCQLFDAGKVSFRFDRESLIAGRPRRRSSPPFHPLIDRLATGQHVQIGWHIFMDGAPMPVAGTEFQLLAAIEHIELGHGQGG